MLKTTDAGVTWQHQDVSTLAGTLADCWFPTRDHGFAVGGVGAFPNGSHAVVLRTSDGGATWGELSYPNVNQQGVGFVTELRGWIGGASNPTYRTDDGGLSWSLSNFAQELNRIRVLRSELAYAVGAKVYRLGIPGLTAAPAAITPAPRPRVEASPHPFGGTTSITFDAREPGHAEIRVVDVRGRNVVTLLAGELPAGERALAWNGRDARGRAVRAGTYFLWLRTTVGDAGVKLQKLP